MNEIAIINTFMSLVLLLALLSFAVRAYPAIRIEEFRQRVFEIRDSLFDEAADGSIGFRDDAYTALRTICNGMLRDAEELTFGHFLSLNIERRIMEGKGFKRIDPFGAALAKLPPAKQGIYKAHSDKLFLAYITLIAERNILLYPVLSAVAYSQRRVAKPIARASAQTKVRSARHYQLLRMDPRVEQQLRQREFDVGQATQMACAA